MKKMKLLLALFAAFVVVAPATVQAQDSLKIAIVDVDKILNVSKAGQSIQQQLKERREAFQKEFSTREKNLMQAEKQLVQEKSTLSAEEFAAKRQDFQKQILETRKLFQKSRNSLDKGLGAAMASLRKHVIEVTAEVADKEGYNVILTRDSVVIVEKKMDVTQQVLDQLNKRVETIKLDIAE